MLAQLDIGVCSSCAAENWLYRDTASDLSPSVCGICAIMCFGRALWHTEALVPALRTRPTPTPRCRQRPDACRRGHPATPENVFFNHLPNGVVRRKCRLCRMIGYRARYIPKPSATVCRAGLHPYDAANTMINPKTGSRRCHACFLLGSKKRRSIEKIQTDQRASCTTEAMGGSMDQKRTTDRTTN